MFVCLTYKTDCHQHLEIGKMILIWKGILGCELPRNCQIIYVHTTNYSRNITNEISCNLIKQQKRTLWLCMKRYFWNYLTQILNVKESRFFSFNYPKQKFSQNYGDRDFEQMLLKISIQLLPKSLENANSTWNSLDRPTNWMALTPFLNVITKGAKNSIKKHQQQKCVGQNNFLNSKHFNLIFCYFFHFT